MSRWQEYFDNHEFWEQWRVLKTELEKADIDDESVLPAVQELARLRKVIAYLDSLMSFIDPELVPQKTWDTFSQQVAPCQQQVLNFNNNKSINHLQQANTHADNLLSYVRPWVVSQPEDAVTAMTDALQDYNKTINGYSEEYRENAKNLVAELNSTKQESDELLDGLKSFYSDAQAYATELFEDRDSRQALKTKIENLVSSFEDESEKVQQLYQQLLVGDEDEPSTKSSCQQAESDIKHCLELAETHLAAIKDERKDLEKFYQRIFGVEKTDEKPEVEGLKAELDARLKHLDSYESQQKLKHETLVEEIEGLLPGATRAGLATAFSEMKKSFTLPIFGYSAMFYLSLLLTVVVSVVTMTDSISGSQVTFQKFETLKDFLNSLGWRLPVLGTAVWLAVFSSKRRSEAQRLKQEYAHKESVASSYNNFKKQIEDLGDDDKEMLKSLIERAIDSIAYNASTTLDGKHGDKAPVQEITEKVLRKIQKQALGKE